jgi:hypothetical protein
MKRNSLIASRTPIFSNGGMCCPESRSTVGKICVYA